MKRDTVYFFKNENPQLNCLKVYNAAGDELSLSGDDSCGTLRHLSRTSLCVFLQGCNTMLVPEQTHVSPENFLRALAAHLGFKVVKR